MKPALTWWQICLSHEHAEELTPLLLSEGALGIEILSPTRARVFCPADSLAREHLRAYARTLGFVEESLEELPYQDWITKSESMLTPINRGKIRVVPIRSAALEVKNDPSTIYIVPGLGFGTGHHETTGMILDLLQLDALRETLPSSGARILDLGTGSGILAIACAKLFNCTVDAIDNDPLAIDNARGNIGLNHVSSLIKPLVGELSDSIGNFDLIISNIYAEILCQLEEPFRERLTVGKPLLISGIMRSKEEQITATFKRERWNYREIRREGDWCAIFLTRR